MIAGVLTKKLDIEKNIKVLKKIGYDGFQFDLKDFGIDMSKKEFLLDKETDNAIKEIQTISRMFDSPILALHTIYPSNVDNKAAIQKTFDKYLNYLSILNCKYLILHISGWNKNKKRLKKVIESLKDIKAKYIKEGVEILLENDHQPSLFVTVNQVINIISKTQLDLCLDTTHAIESGVNLDDFYSKLRQNIKIIHLSDYNNKPHQAIGTGDLNKFKAYKKIIGSKKLLILEIGGSLNDAKNKKDIIKIYTNSFKTIQENL